MKKALILSGDGINCERETACAFEFAGAKTHIIHINELLKQPTLLLDFAIFCIPGGFSFGDELRSGKILAEKIRAQLGDVFEKFTHQGGLTIGICNGFQVLIQLGAFSGIKNERKATLATNDHGEFVDRWVDLEIHPNANQSPWFKGMSGKIQLPIRHKEGRIVLQEGLSSDQFSFPLRYVEDVNGSVEQSASMLDSTGQVLGLMPHPEAATEGFLNPMNRADADMNALQNSKNILKRSSIWGYQMKLKRALVSVSDKAGLVPFCQFLHSKGIELVSTGGTAKTLLDAGIPVIPIEKITGNPEAFGGRMKTISFQVGSALLFRRDHEQDLMEAQKLGIESIDLVICNLYPFEKTARSGAALPELIENIDIGGPTMVRAAAKNYQYVACITSPASYAEVEAEILNTNQISIQTRERLALQAFTQIASYDLSIAAELSQRLQGGQSLRYGENPHQRASLLQINNTDSNKTLANAKILQGKEISYNNYLDADQAYKCTSELSNHAGNNAICVIVKHGIPCGVAQHAHPLSALKMAWDADSTSAFGGILCFNKEVSASIAEWLNEKFVELVIAPGFTPDARKIFSSKKNVRLLECALKDQSSKEWTVRSINGGVLCQDEDQGISIDFKNVTKSEYPDRKIPLLNFGLVVTKYLKSNCIGIFSEKNDGLTVITSGVGQPNRLDCITRLIASRLKEKNEDLSEAILVSDAFFPFKDSIEAANELGVKYIAQPGGSIRDPEVIEACDHFGISMVMTGKRHFRH